LREKGDGEDLQKKKISKKNHTKETKWCFGKKKNYCGKPPNPWCYREKKASNQLKKTTGKRGKKKMNSSDKPPIDRMKRGTQKIKGPPEGENRHFLVFPWKENKIWI